MPKNDFDTIIEKPVFYAFFLIKINDLILHGTIIEAPTA